MSHAKSVVAPGMWVDILFVHLTWREMGGLSGEGLAHTASVHCIASQLSI